MKHPVSLLLAMVMTTAHFSQTVSAQISSTRSTRDFTYAFTPPAPRLPQHPQTNPPIPQLDIEAQTFEISSKCTTANILTLPNGNKLIVPPSAFETKDGKPVKGNVTIAYREFKNPLDIFLSGIPMTYDSGAQHNLFQSAGMFEITAMANNQPVQLKKNKTIQVEFTTVSNDDTYQFYQLNESDGNWSHQMPVAFAQRTQKGKRLKGFNANRRFQSNTSSPSITLMPDTTSFAMRYADENRYFLFDKGFTSQHFHTITSYPGRREYPSGKAYKTQYVNLKQNRALIHLMPVLNAARQVSQVALFEDQRNRIFYELKSFPFKNWVLEDPIDYTEYIPEFKKNRRFHDVRVLYDQNSNYCTLEFKTSKGFCSMKVNLERTLKCKPELAKMRFAKYYNRYKIVLKNRENSFNTEMWQKYRNATQRIYYDSALQAANKLFSVSALGIYNCDQTYRMYPIAQVKPKFIFTESSTKVEQVAVVDKKANAAFWFNANSFAISPPYLLSLVIKGTNGALYYIPAADLKELKAGSLYPELHPLPIPPNCSKETLAEIMGLSLSEKVTASN